MSAPCLPLDESDFLRQLRIAIAERFRQGLQEIPGAKSLLQSLQIPFAVATNGPREKTELTLGLTDIPEEVVRQVTFIARLPELHHWL